jgi:hypothetical protein
MTIPLIEISEQEWREDSNSKTFYELQGLINQKEKMGASYRGIFPNVDPYLVHELVLRMYHDPVKNKNKGPMYTVEVFTEKGTDSQKCRDHILATTGTVPGIYDKGTHYVTHMRLTLEILKKLNDFDFVLGVMGDYTGSNPSMGPMHEFDDFEKRRQKVDHRKKNIS